METSVRTTGELAWELLERRASTTAPLSVSNDDEASTNDEVEQRIERLRTEGGEPSAGSCCGNMGGWGN